MFNAWVISGAGARGAFQAGVMARLDQTEDAPNYLIGCSAGALNVAGYSRVGWIGLRDIWDGIRSRADVLKIRYNPLSWTHLTESVFDSSPLEGIISRTLRHARMKPYTVVYSDLKTLLPVYVDNPDDVDPHLASASIPGVFPPVQGYMVDGGLLECAPLDYALTKCPAEGGRVTVILGSSLQEAPAPSFTAANILDTIGRSVDAITDQIMRDNVFDINCPPGVKIRLIEPKDLHMGSLDFDGEKIQAAWKLGYAQVPPAFR